MTKVLDKRINNYLVTFFFMNQTSFVTIAKINSSNSIEPIWVTKFTLKRGINNFPHNFFINLLLEVNL